MITLTILTTLLALTVIATVIKETVLTLTVIATVIRETVLAQTIQYTNFINVSRGSSLHIGKLIGDT